MSKRLTFTQNELAAVASKVNTGRESLSAPLASADKAAADKYAAIYTKNKGNIAAIFKELGGDAAKATKNPPTNAADFGRKYTLGFYDKL